MRGYNRPRRDVKGRYRRLRYGLAGLLKLRAPQWGQRVGGFLPFDSQDQAQRAQVQAQTQTERRRRRTVTAKSLISRVCVAGAPAATRATP